MKMTNYCINCGKEICIKAKRCRSCALKERFKNIKNHPQYGKKGKENAKYGQRHSVKTKKLMSRIKKGKNNPRYIDGRCSKEYYCKELNCNNKICYQTWIGGEGRCCSCANRIKEVEKWSNRSLEEKNRLIKIWMKTMKLKPNKIEKVLTKLLQQILPNEYEYVGDGKVIINSFNPDFVNCRDQKKIIELYGDYWHNRKGSGEKDRRKLVTYQKYGYKILIIWEHELKSLDKLRRKILNFNIIKI